MLFSSLRLCRFIDFWSTSLLNSGFCRPSIGARPMVCVCSRLHVFYVVCNVPVAIFFRSQFFSLLACGSMKNIDDIPMRSKTPSLAEMKCICAWKFVRSSYIGGDIRGQNYLEDTISLNKMMSFSL